MRLGQRWQRRGRCRGAAGTSCAAAKLTKTRHSALAPAAFQYTMRAVQRKRRSTQPCRYSGISPIGDNRQPQPLASYRCDVAATCAFVAGGGSGAVLEHCTTSIHFQRYLNYIIREGGGAPGSQPIVRCCSTPVCLLVRRKVEEECTCCVVLPPALLLGRSHPTRRRRFKLVPGTRIGAASDRGE